MRIFLTINNKRGDENASRFSTVAIVIGIVNTVSKVKRFVISISENNNKHDERRKSRFVEEWKVKRIWCNWFDATRRYISDME